MIKDDRPTGLTPGRVVHYVAYGTPGGEYAAGAHRAAIITELPSFLEAHPRYGYVRLCVLNPTGLHFPDKLIPYDQAAVNPGTWHWPERV